MSEYISNQIWCHSIGHWFNKHSQGDFFIDSMRWYKCCFPETFTLKLSSTNRYLIGHHLWFYKPDAFIHLCYPSGDKFLSSKILLFFPLVMGRTCFFWFLNICTVCVIACLIHIVLCVLLGGVLLTTGCTHMFPLVSPGRFVYVKANELWTLCVYGAVEN